VTGLHSDQPVDARGDLLDWTVADVEAAMWRVRAAGGGDSTAVYFDWAPSRADGHGGTRISADADDDGMVPYYDRPDPEEARSLDRADRRGTPLATAGVWAVRVAALPVVGIPLLYAWSWMLDLMGIR
jgi:hypothetical protein